MRPRHKTAENGDLLVAPPGHALASMRPRHKTAENDLKDATVDIIVDLLQ